MSQRNSAESIRLFHNCEKPQLLLIGLLALVLLPSCRPANEVPTPPTAEQSWERFTFREPHLGTYAGLVFYAPNGSVANRAAAAVYDRIGELDAVFSTYREDSELQRLCRNPDAAHGVTVSDDLGNVLEIAQRISRQSKGAFDVTVGPVTRIWKQAIRRKRLPMDAAIQQSMQSVGYDFLQIKKSAVPPDEPALRYTVTLLRPKMRIDLAAIAKGYIADAALATLREHGCHSGLVDLGGDLAMGDPPPGKEGWSIAMPAGKSGTNPGAEFTTLRTLHNCGLATSGDTFQHLTIDGQRYSHIVDARTGQATTHSLTVTVISPTCVMADALASTVSVLGSQPGRDFVQSLPDSEASILPGKSHKNPAVRLTTTGFPAGETPAAAATVRGTTVEATDANKKENEAALSN